MHGRVDWTARDLRPNYGSSGGSRIDVEWIEHDMRLQETVQAASGSDECGMTSLYADYILERTNDHIIESTNGFVTYRFINDGNSVYIVDIFTVPKNRRAGQATELADMVVKEAKARGCTELLGTVVPSTKNSTSSLKVLLGYGMSLYSASTDLVVFRKEI